MQTVIVFWVSIRRGVVNSNAHIHMPPCCKVVHEAGLDDLLGNDDGMNVQFASLAVLQRQLEVLILCIDHFGHRGLSRSHDFRRLALIRVFHFELKFLGLLEVVPDWYGLPVWTQVVLSWLRLSDDVPLLRLLLLFIDKAHWV